MLDVIVPCYNEEKVIEDFYNKTKESLKNIKHNFIFINDGSNDKTLEKLKNIYNNDKECIKIINFSRNFGKESAIQAGLKYSKGKYQCLIDADLQQNPKYLVKMYNFLEENTDYDCIAMCQKQHKKRFFQELFYKVMDKLSDIHIENGASDFRMFKHDVTKSILNLNEKNRFTKGIFSYVGYNTYYDTIFLRDCKRKSVCNFCRFFEQYAPGTKKSTELNSVLTFCEKYGILRYATILTVWFASSQSTSKPHTEARLRRR